MAAAGRARVDLGRQEPRPGAREKAPAETTEPSRGGLPLPFGSLRGAWAIAAGSKGYHGRLNANRK
jgi:hypothetical protein